MASTATDSKLVLEQKQLAERTTLTERAERTEQTAEPERKFQILSSASPPIGSSPLPAAGRILGLGLHFNMTEGLSTATYAITAKATAVKPTATVLEGGREDKREGPVVSKGERLGEQWRQREFLGKFGFWEAARAGRVTEHEV